MLSKTEIHNRLKALFQEYEPCPEEYQQWAVEVMPGYQNLLNDMGLGIYTVVGHHPSDKWLDAIHVREPWGEELSVPDPDTNGRKIDFAKTEKFFVDLMLEIKREMREVLKRRKGLVALAAAAMEAAFWNEEARKALGVGETERMFACFKKAARFTSIGIWYRKEKKV